MRYLSLSSSVAVIFLAVVVALTIAFTPPKCEHEEVMKYEFASNNSTERSNASRYCTKCDKRISTYSLFKGELVDKSYLRAIVDHSDGSEIKPGEYYTVTAIVTQADYGYGLYNTPNVCCKLENEDFIIYLDVEFREEFAEAVDLIIEGQEITFRGRFYDEGCGFTDCELIIE